MNSFKKINDPWLPSAIIILFHCIGAVGLIFAPFQFLKLSVFNLLLSAVMLFWKADLKPMHYLVILTIALLTFFIEVIGVYTGLPFGEYYYGTNLGPKLLDVPLIIGLNWIMLLFATHVILRKQSFYVSVIGASILMVILDVVIEQSVNKMGFWFWKDNQIPLANYVSWFCISLLLSLYIRKKMPLKENKAALTLYLTQISFFLFCLFLF